MEKNSMKFKKLRRILKIFAIVSLLVFPIALTSYSLVRGGGNFATFSCLSTDTKPTGAYPGDTIYETDTGLMYIYNGSAWSITTIMAVTDTSWMFAPGNGAAQATRGYNECTIYYTVSTINTSIAAAMQLKAGNSAWTAVATDSTVITANGDYGFYSSSISTADSIRFKWISESSGTDAKILHNMKLSNAVK